MHDLDDIDVEPRMRAVLDNLEPSSDFSSRIGARVAQRERHRNRSRVVVDVEVVEVEPEPGELPAREIRGPGRPAGARRHAKPRRPRLHERGRAKILELDHRTTRKN